MSEVARLVRWYAREWAAEAEGIVQLHAGVGDDGAPAWSTDFERFLLRSAWTTYEDSPFYRKPMRAALAYVATKNARHHRYLTLLRASWDARDTAQELAALRHLRQAYRLAAPARLY